MSKHHDHHHDHDHDHHHDHDHDHDHSHAFGLVEALRIAFVFIVLMLVWLSGRHFNSTFNYLGVFATLIGGYPIFKAAFSALLDRKMTMELSMTIALLAALAIGEVFTALLITFFVLIAEVLEGMTVDRGRRAIRSLLDLMPREALIRQHDSEHRANIDDLKPGDIVIVKPGTRIPIDGVVKKGTTFVDQATITGESMPVEKMIGSEVYAGTINQSGAIEVETHRAGKDTAFGKIIQAVEAAEKSRAPIQKIADRLSGYLVYFAIGAAILTYLITHDIRSTISVIIVAGACGVAAGTPLAILGAIGRAASMGSIVKGGLYMEALSTVDTVVFDKTGTLTYGTPTVIEILPVSDIEEQMVLEKAAIAERLSEHSIAKAILRRAAEKNVRVIEPERFEYQPGKGITCWVGEEKITVGNLSLLQEQHIPMQEVAAASNDYSDVYVASNNRLLGIIRISDIIRQEAFEAVRRVNAMGLKTVLLTGDSAKVADKVAKQLGVMSVEAELMPEEKASRIRAMINAGGKVAMVGDGINDAPALTEASVGVAMGTGTDVARESADVVLLGNDLFKFVETITIAKRCRRIILANFAGTVMVDTAGILLAAAGFLSPPLAAFIHVSSELLFILNSARLLPKLAPKKTIKDSNEAISGSTWRVCNE